MLVVWPQIDCFGRPSLSFNFYFLQSGRFFRAFTSTSVSIWPGHSCSPLGEVLRQHIATANLSGIGGWWGPRGPRGVEGVVWGAMLCVMGEECQYLAVKYRVEEIMFLPHEAFHYFKLPLQSRLKDPSSSSPDKSSSNARMGRMNDLTGVTAKLNSVDL